MTAEPILDPDVPQREWDVDQDEIERYLASLNVGSANGNGARTAGLPSEAGWPAPLPCAELEPGGTPVAALDAVRRYAGQGADETSVLVGHEPLLSELAALLLTGQPNGASLLFKKGAAACFEFLERPGDPTQPGHRKSDAPRLLWLAQPRLLRALAR